MGEIRPLKDELPKADTLLEARIVSHAINKPTKTFDQAPSFGCVGGDRGNSEIIRITCSDDSPPSFTALLRRGASKIAIVDQSLVEVNFEEASATPLAFGESYPHHDLILPSPTNVLPSIRNYGYQSYEVPPWEKLPSPCDIKVHGIMCTKLMKVVDRIDKIFPEIEASRPRCSSGIQSLCLLNSAISKARSLVRDCSEQSKLYLALADHEVLSRCEKYKKLLEESLSQIQNMVPAMLASKISVIIVELSEMELGLDPYEEEAGKIIRALVERYIYETGTHESDHEYIRIAALKLHITSHTALVIERRSIIKKLRDKYGEGDNTQPKKRILKFLLALLEKYGNLIASGHLENDNVVQN